MTSMDQKIVVVTGAAGAIGRAAVAVLKREGATVVGVDLNNVDDTGADHFVACDLTHEDEVRSMYAGVAARYGRIDGLFNNAGIVLPEDGSVLTVAKGAFDQTLFTNVGSIFLCCKYGIPHLIASGGGSVVNTASLVATMGSAVSQIGYTASKGAVLSLSRELAVEFALKGVRVNTLSPGPVDSPMLRSVLPQDQVARRMVHVPMGRFGSAAEMAEGAAFLLSDASSFITGLELKVDGGLSAAFVTPEE